MIVNNLTGLAGSGEPLHGVKSAQVVEQWSSMGGKGDIDAFQAHDISSSPTVAPLLGATFGFGLVLKKINQNPFICQNFIFVKRQTLGAASANHYKYNLHYKPHMWHALR